MTTVLDRFVVELGLDPKQFNQGQREAVSRFKATQEELGRRGKDIEQGSKSIGQAFSTLKAQAIGLFAVFTGGRGLVNFTTGVAQADNAVGRLSRNIGQSVSVISQWQGATRIVGGTGEELASQFTALSDAFAGWKIGLTSPLIADLRAISAAGGTVIDVNKGIDESFLDLAANLKAIHDRDPATAGVLGRKIGLTPAFFDLLIRGRTEVKRILEESRGLGLATEQSAREAAALNAEFQQSVLVLEDVGRSVVVNLVEPLKAALGLVKNIKQARDEQKRQEAATGKPGQLTQLFMTDEQLRALPNRGPQQGYGPRSKSGTSARPPTYAELKDAFGPVDLDAELAVERANIRKFLHKLFGSEEAIMIEAMKAGYLADAFGGARSDQPAGSGGGGAIRVKPGAGVASDSVGKLASDIQGSIAGIKQFTAFNDAYHALLGKSAHSKGRALDFTIDDPARSAEIAERIRSKLRAMGVEATVLDEYKNPSKNSTAPHIHVQLNSAAAAAAYSRAVTSGAAEGNAGGADGRVSSNTSNTTSTRISVGQVVVQTPATDGPGVARDFKAALERSSTAANANAGQQ